MQSRNSIMMSCFHYLSKSTNCRRVDWLILLCRGTFILFLSKRGNNFIWGVKVIIFILLLKRHLIDLVVPYDWYSLFLDIDKDISHEITFQINSSHMYFCSVLPWKQFECILLFTSVMLLWAETSFCEDIINLIITMNSSWNFLFQHNAEVVS